MARHQRPHVVRGLDPGRNNPGAGQVRWTTFVASAPPVSLADGTAYLEDYGLAYQERTHAAVKPLVWLTLGAALFVLIVFPFFFRSSLVRPLERLLAGVRRVDAGELEAEVPVGVADEIGTLTQHFNGMTASLRRAEQELRAYAEHLEERVEERTAALERSLAELKATQAQLVQQEKLASLGSLTAGIAHEIKNPLNFVNNFAEVNEELADELREAYEADPDIKLADLLDVLGDLKQNAGVIAQHGRRADAIVKSMMQHASGGQGRREKTDVNALVSEYLDLAYHGKRATLPGFNVEIIRSLGEEAGTLEIVPQEMGRVLLNLLNNAFDAVHERAQTENGAYVPTVEVSTRRVGDRVEIRVSDNGPGIPPEVRERVFEPFFTTKPAGGGTGLGLSLSYDIVTQGHGGTLTLEGEPGAGAIVVVALPAPASPGLR
jgi:signal transduction histidine kinase